jgi:hypothetical protein
MATAGAQLLSTSFAGQTAGFTRAGCSGRNSERAAGCRVTCSSGVGSRVRESLKMAVLLPIAACTVLAASPLQGFGFYPFFSFGHCCVSGLRFSLSCVRCLHSEFLLELKCSMAVDFSGFSCW